MLSKVGSVFPPRGSREDDCDFHPERTCRFALGNNRTLRLICGNIYVACMVHGVLLRISQRRDLRYFPSSTLLPQSEPNLDSATGKIRGRKICPFLIFFHRAHPQAANLSHRACKSAFIVTSACLDKHATTQADARKWAVISCLVSATGNEH